MSETTTNYTNKYITWECTTQCNYACRYCWPACHDGKYRWPDSDKTNRLIEYIENFSDGKRVILDIMGGEPTLWPDLQRFCHSVGDYTDITFSSNGSRTARWWSKFTAPINHLLFSFHPENADLDHYVAMLKQTHQRYRISVLILYHPDFKDICLRAWDRLTQGDLEISCRMKRINSPDHSKQIFSVDYTEEDREILLWDYYNCSVKMVHPEMYLYINGVQKDPQTLIATDQHSFTGWQCNLGNSTYRYITADGTIYGSACEMRSPMGNVYTLGEIKPAVTLNCAAKFCDCAVDLVLNKRHDLRIQ